MIDVSVLPVYLTAVLALLLIPGPDMLLIASSSMSYGRRVGLFASLGNATSGMILTLLAALGVSALIAMNPLALNVLHLLGEHTCSKWRGIAYAPMQRKRPPWMSHKR